MALPTRDQLLDAAAKVFAEHGFRGSTTRRIADAAGVNEVTLFRLFGSKEALLGEAVRTRVYERDVPQLPEIPGDDPRAELVKWAAAEHAHVVAHRSSIRQGMSELGERPDLSQCMAQGPRGVYAQLRNYFDALKADGRAGKDANSFDTAAMLVGVIFADAMGRDFVPDVLSPVAKAPAAYVDLTLRAIGYTTRPTTPRRRSTTARTRRA